MLGRTSRIHPVQQRDTHEIFAEPVDQAEHDAFLIPKNAMHFNSSGTVYFRQQNIHVLKTNPGNFEVEFPVTRRRSMRRLQNDIKEQDTLKEKRQRTFIIHQGAAPIDSAFLLGNRHSQWLSSRNAGPRSPYEFSCRPSLYHETSSFMCNKSLILDESTSMVANRKSLNNGVQPPTCLGFAAFAAVKSQSNTGVLTSSQKLSSPVGGFGSVLSDKMDLTNAAKEMRPK
ncbi:hypothetical protein HAX54_047252 [Datura stramonium]|uniref:Uncharacterized protein n=1 Tax=Datura stramonium TaxID=4076 RepID=A0ABS8RQI8_DATST|nr:hypothetical protein [Datura stramonium]